jgi:hypothetical protein
MKTIFMAVMFAIANSVYASESTEINQVSQDDSFRGAAYNGKFTNETALAYDKSFVYDFGNTGMNRITAVVNYSSANPASATFTDGRTSEGTITVSSITSLCGTVVKIASIPFNMGGCPPYDSRTHTIVAIGATTTTAANNLCRAITVTNTYTAAIATCTTSGGVISLVSKKSDEIAHALSSSSSSITVSGTGMTSGVAATYNATSDKITVASHGWTLGLPLLYASNARLISGLTNQATYYAVPVDVDTLYLATTSALAQAGVYHANMSVQLASATAVTYTLAPLAIEVATTGFHWEQSNDNAVWIDVNIDSVTISDTGWTAPYATDAWDFDIFNYRYLRMNVNAPATGGMYLVSDVYIKKQ